MYYTYFTYNWKDKKPLHNPLEIKSHAGNVRDHLQRKMPGETLCIARIRHENGIHTITYGV